MKKLGGREAGLSSFWKRLCGRPATLPVKRLDSKTEAGDASQVSNPGLRKSCRSLHLRPTASLLEICIKPKRKARYPEVGEVGLQSGQEVRLRCLLSFASPQSSIRSSLQVEVPGQRISRNVSGVSDVWIGEHCRYQASPTRTRETSLLSCRECVAGIASKCRP
jgi:hypothetical protein